MVATTGAVEKDYLYDAFGNQVDDETNQPFNWRVEAEPVAEADYNPFRYTGEYFDYETGYIYLRARYYNSANGRFISEDPICSGGNWYGYCNGNPIKFVDPMGLAATYDGYTEEEWKALEKKKNDLKDRKPSPAESAKKMQTIDGDAGGGGGGAAPITRPKPRKPPKRFELTNVDG